MTMCLRSPPPQTQVHEDKARVCFVHCSGTKDHAAARLGADTQGLVRVPVTPKSTRLFLLQVMG